MKSRKIQRKRRVSRRHSKKGLRKTYRKKTRISKRSRGGRDIPTTGKYAKPDIDYANPIMMIETEGDFTQVSPPGSPPPTPEGVENIRIDVDVDSDTSLSSDFARRRLFSETDDEDDNEEEQSRSRSRV